MGNDGLLGETKCILGLHCTTLWKRIEEYSVKTCILRWVNYKKKGFKKNLNLNLKIKFKFKKKG